LTTWYFLGELWLNLNLDLLIICRNSPGNSRYNEIERLWGYLNRKMAGLILPTQKENETKDEAEDNAIKLLINSALQDLKFSNHPVKCIQVPCNGSNVNVDGEVLENETILQDEESLIHKIMSDKTMRRRKLRELHPAVSQKFKIISDHMDSRAHGYIFRKCNPHGGYQCQHCKDHPGRGSKELWSSLPDKKQGGLFFAPEEDPDKPGHYATLLSLIKKVETLEIKADAVFGVERCKENGCLYTFKSNTDKIRHMRIFHDQDKVELKSVCRFKKEDGSICNQEFDTPFKMQKHKSATGHKVSKKK